MHLQTNSKVYIPQLAVMKESRQLILRLKVTTLKDLEDDYINKENNLLMLYTAYKYYV